MLMKSSHRELVRRVGDLPLEEVACYLCGETHGRVLVDDPPFRVLLCQGCGLGYTSPRLVGDRIHEIYGDAYFSSESAEAFGYSAYAEDVEGYLKTFRRKLRILGRHVSAGPVLEVGCAAGAFLKVMEDRGHEVWGVEIAPAMLEAARERFGFGRLFLGPLADVVGSLPRRYFGTIALFDVVEHLSDPLRELAMCRELLAPGGTLVLQTQNVDSRTRKVLGHRWHHFKQLEHIYHFSPKTLDVLLGRAGFTIEKLTYRDAGKYVSLDFVADRAQRVAHLPAALCRPLRWMGRRFVYVNPLDEMLVVARESDT
jgi:SAM-dependent methyltransferase